MVAACAAMVSFTGLTGCGGGGGGGGVGGNAYLTLDGFKGNANGVCLKGGSVWAILEPEGEAPGSPKDSDTKVFRLCTLYNSSFSVENLLTSYEITGGTPDKPLSGKISFAFESSSDTEDPDVLAVLGLGLPTDFIGTVTSNVEITMYFDGAGGGQMSVEVTGSESTEVINTTTLETLWNEKLSTWSDFYVTQK